MSAPSACMAFGGRVSVGGDPAAGDGGEQVGALVEGVAGVALDVREGQLAAPGGHQLGQRDQGGRGPGVPGVQVVLRGHPAGLPAPPRMQVAERDDGVDQQGDRAGDAPQGEIDGAELGDQRARSAR